MFRDLSQSGEEIPVLQKRAFQDGGLFWGSRREERSRGMGVW